MAVDPQQIQAAQAIAAKIPGGSEILADVAKAGSMLAAGSVVPGIGTIGGAVVALVTVIGPALFKGVASVFSGPHNPWPARERALAAEPDPERRYRAAWAMEQMAIAAARHPRDLFHVHSEVQWAVNSAGRTKAIKDAAWSALPQSARDRLQPGLTWEGFSTADPARYRTGPFTMAQLEAMIAEMRRLIATAPPGADRAGMMRVAVAIATVLAERQRVAPPHAPPAPTPPALLPAPAPPPAPPAPGATAQPNPWPAWFVAALAAQKAGRAVPPPPPIPPVLPASMPPMWVAWATMTRAAQAARLPPPFPPPPIPLPWAA